MVKFEPTTPNMLQHIATWRPNARDMLGSTMLRFVALACCDRLTGALNLYLFTAFQFNSLLRLETNAFEFQSYSGV